jgi:hypothetical protein
MLLTPEPSFPGGRPLLLLLVSMATNLSWRGGWQQAARSAGGGSVTRGGGALRRGAGGRREMRRRRRQPPAKGSGLTNKREGEGERGRRLKEGSCSCTQLLPWRRKEDLFLGRGFWD